MQITLALQTRNILNVHKMSAELFMCVQLRLVPRGLCLRSCFSH